jgi:hypothetical protein
LVVSLLQPGGENKLQQQQLPFCVVALNWIFTRRTCIVLSKNSQKGAVATSNKSHQKQKPNESTANSSKKNCTTGFSINNKKK